MENETNEGVEPQQPVSPDVPVLENDVASAPAVEPNPLEAPASQISGAVDQPKISFASPQEIGPVSTNVSQPQVKYAGFWIRWVANFVDGIVAGVVGFVIGVPLGIVYYMATRSTEMSLMASISLRLVGTLVGWVYLVFFTYKYQATLGKMMVGIKVVSDKSENLSLGQVILRETLGKFISAILLLIGYIMAGFTARKQALHDKMASTLVIYKDPNKKIGGWVYAAVVLACILPVIAIIGILASIVLVSLSSARNKANDAAIKATLSSTVAQAMIYSGDHQTLKGFQPKITFPTGAAACSGQPIVNVSPDGNSVAFFAKLCTSKGTYYCIDSDVDNGIGKGMEVDEKYALGGAASCSPVPAKETAAIQAEPQKETTVAQPTLPNTFQDAGLPYTVGYPEGWKYKKEQDKDGISVTFSDEKSTSGSNVIISSTGLDQEASPSDVDQFIKGSKDYTISLKGKVYDEKVFSYSFDDGSVITGKHFKTEYAFHGVPVKQWVIVLPKEKTLYAWIYTAQADQFEKDYDDASNILNTWKIKK